MIRRVPKGARGPVAAIAALAGAGALAAASAVTSPNPEALVGRWQVDLRPTPDAEAYFQPFVVTSVAGDSIVGTFYGAPIRDGRFNDDWGALRFAFVTEDSSGFYNHSGTLEGDRISGLTHSIGRGFLSVWTAMREE